MTSSSRCQRPAAVAGVASPCHAHTDRTNRNTSLLEPRTAERHGARHGSTTCDFFVWHQGVSFICRMRTHHLPQPFLPADRPTRSMHHTVQVLASGLHSTCIGGFRQTPTTNACCWPSPWLSTCARPRSCSRRRQSIAPRRPTMMTICILGSCATTLATHLLPMNEIMPCGSTHCLDDVLGERLALQSVVAHGPHEHTRELIQHVRLAVLVNGNMFWNVNVYIYTVRSTASWSARMRAP